MFSSDCRKNEKIDTLSSDNKRLRCERDSAEDTLHQEQRALRDSHQWADEKLSNMELLLATRDTALKMQERATEQLEEENIKLYEKCRIQRNISRQIPREIRGGSCASGANGAQSAPTAQGNPEGHPNESRYKFR